MPRIPQFTNQRVIQSRGISPVAAAAPYHALTVAGGQVAHMGNQFSQIDDALKRAARAVKAAEIESLIDNGLKDAAESYRMRTDFENFQDDAEKSVRDIQEQYGKEIGEDPVLRQSVDLAFNDKSADFMRTIRAKTAEQITNRGKGRLETIRNEYIDQYAKAQTPGERDLIRNKLTAITNSFAESNIIPFKEAETFIDKFDDDSEAVRADRYIEVDPESALSALKDGSFEKLDPQIKQDKIEKAETAIERQEREQRLESDRKDKALEETRKEVIKKNDLYMIQAFYDEYIDEAELDRLADNQMISESTYKWIKGQIGEKSEPVNNPEILGPIVQGIEFKRFDAVDDELDLALSSGDVDTNTYISLKKSLATDMMADATGYINKAIQPGEFETDPNPKRRWADAIRDLGIRVANNEHPLKVAYDIIQLNERRELQTLSKYRKPRYLKVDLDRKLDIPALDEAANETVEKYYSDIINEQQYKREMELIEQIKSTVNYLNRNRQAQSEMGGTNDTDKKMKELGITNR